MRKALDEIRTFIEQETKQPFDKVRALSDIDFSKYLGTDVVEMIYVTDNEKFKDEFIMLLKSIYNELPKFGNIIGYNPDRGYDKISAVLYTKRGQVVVEIDNLEVGRKGMEGVDCYISMNNVNNLQKLYEQDLIFVLENTYLDKKVSDDDIWEVCRQTGKSKGELIRILMNLIIDSNIAEIKESTRNIKDESFLLHKQELDNEEFTTVKDYKDFYDMMGIGNEGIEEKMLFFEDMIKAGMDDKDIMKIMNLNKKTFKKWKKQLEQDNTESEPEPEKKSTSVYKEQKPEFVEVMSFDEQTKPDTEADTESDTEADTEADTDTEQDTESDIDFIKALDEMDKMFNSEQSDNAGAGNK